MAKVSLFWSFLILGFLFASISECSDEVGVYELKRGDFSLKLTNWGATVMSVILPDRNGWSSLCFCFSISCWFSFCFLDFYYVFGKSHQTQILFLFLVNLHLVVFILPGKLDDVVLGFDTPKEYMVRFIKLAFMI